LILIHCRAYGMTVEQAIQAKMYEIAQTYTNASERKTNIDAANKFRLPFWNPFQARDVQQTNPTDVPVMGISLLFCVRKINVKRPNTDTYTPINNPLYAYLNPIAADLKKAYGGFVSVPAWIDGFLRAGDNSTPLEAYTVRCGTRGQAYSDHVKLQQFLSQKMPHSSGNAIMRSYCKPELG
jgi:hypothetical protein